MRVIVAGAGALGSLLGAYLAQSDEEVFLLARQSNVDAIRRQGGMLISGIRGEKRVSVAAGSRLDDIHQPAELVILGTKSQDSEAMLETIAPVVGTQTQILTPLNGVANEDWVIRKYGQHRLLAAVTAINASTKEPGHVFHAAKSRLDLGDQGNQDPDLIKQIVAVFNRAGIAAVRREDIMRLKWWKMAVFCGVPY